MLYFCNSQEPFICVQLDQKYRNVDDLQAVVQRVVDAEVKAACLAPLLMRKSHERCSCGYKPLKNKKSKGQKNSLAKIAYSLIINSDSGNLC